MSTFSGKKKYSGLERNAYLSKCGKYRYWLKREWKTGGNGKDVCFIMLNPSTADENTDDPTIRRYMGFAQQWGFSSLTVRNLFPYRATKPKDLLNVTDPSNGARGLLEMDVARWSHFVIVAWGSWVPFNQDIEALKILSTVPLYCLGKTKNGKPRHPLYAPLATEVIPFVP